MVQGPHTAAATANTSTTTTSFDPITSVTVATEMTVLARSTSQASPDGTELVTVIHKAAYVDTVADIVTIVTTTTTGPAAAINIPVPVATMSSAAVEHPASTTTSAAAPTWAGIPGEGW